MEIFDVRARSHPHERADPTALKGDVVVNVRMSQVDPRDIASVDLLLGSSAIPCDLVPAPTNRTDAFPERSISASCPWDTEMLQGECSGNQITPMYPSGQYRLRAELVTGSGDVHQSSAWNVTLNNQSFLKVVHDPGMSIVHDGRVFHGGSNSGGNMSVFSVCPVSYKKDIVVRELILDTQLVGTKQQHALPQGPPLKLRRPTTAEMTTRSISPDPSFMWVVDPTLNARVSNTAEDEYWLVIAGEIIGNDGQIFTDEFLSGDQKYVYGPLYFDFMPPIADDPEIQVNGESIAAGTFYSEHVDNEFTVAGIVDEGVGIGRENIRIDVGDCALNPRIVDNAPVDRSTVPFIATYENVQSIFDLAEDDAYVGEYGRPDTNGLDCYVAELIGLQDRLGNRLPEPLFLQTNNFGVDKQSPEIHSIRFDGPIFSAIPEIYFRIEDPLLASGDEGAPILASNARATIRDTVAGTQDSVAAIDVGSVLFDLEDSDRATALLDGLTGDGSYTVSLEVVDGATPPNGAEVSVEFAYDRSSPSISQLNGPNTLIYASGSVAIRVSGRVGDAVAGVDEITLSVWNNDATPGVCDSNDLSSRRAPLKRMRNLKRKIVQFDETITIMPPSGGNTVEPLCVFVRASDVVGNETLEMPVSRFAVDWGG